MKYYFLLQFKRLKREIKGFGVDPYAGIAIFILSFILISISFFKKFQAAAFIYGGLALGTVFLMSNKSRNEYLRSIFFHKKFVVLRIIENILCALPFSVFLVIKKEFMVASLLLISSILLSFYGGGGFRLNFSVPSPFSKRPYEFTTGFRSMYWLLALIYSVSGLSVYYHNPNLGILSFLSVFFLCMSFYSHLDPIFYVWIHAKSPENFLKGKIKTALRYSLYLTLPVLFLLIVSRPRTIYWLLITLAVGLCYVTLSVLSVYVNFPVKMRVSHFVLLYIGIFFPPALIGVLPYFYIQATQRLKEYLPC
jgi:hypothetical protein